MEETSLSMPTSVKWIRGLSILQLAVLIALIIVIIGLSVTTPTHPFWIGFIKALTGGSTSLSPEQAGELIVIPLIGIITSVFVLRAVKKRHFSKVAIGFLIAYIGAPLGLGARPALLPIIILILFFRSSAKEYLNA